MTDRQREEQSEPDADDVVIGGLSVPAELAELLGDLRPFMVRDAGGRPVTVYLPGRTPRTATELAVLLEINRNSLTSQGWSGLDTAGVGEFEKALATIRASHRDLTVEEAFEALAPGMPVMLRYAFAQGDQVLARTAEENRRVELRRSAEFDELPAEQVEAENQKYLLDLAIEAARRRPDVVYHPSGPLEGFWWQPVEGSPTWFRLEDNYEAIRINSEEGRGFAGYEAADSNDRKITQNFAADAGYADIEPEKRTVPFVGGIPADYLSNRVIGRQVSAEEQAVLDRFEQAGLDPLWMKRAYGPLGDATAGPGAPLYAGPVHEEFDQYALFAGKDPAYVAAWQQQMIRAGYLEPGHVLGHEGLWLETDGEAMRNALFEANVNGYGDDLEAWFNLVAGQRETLETDEFNRRYGAGGGTGAAAPRYRAPDYALLAQTVKADVGARVGREVKDYELAILAEELRANFRAQYDAERSAVRGGGGGNHLLEIAELRLANTAAGLPSEQGVPEILARSGAGGGGTVQTVDPLARLRESIDRRFGGEIERNQRVADIQGQTRHMMNLLAGAEGAVGA